MKTLILSLSLFSSLSFAAELDLYYEELPFPQSAYGIKLEAGESAEVEIGRTTTFDCWRAFNYTTLGDKNKKTFSVLKENAVHPAIVCAKPKKIIEGTVISVKNKQAFADYVILYVPQGDKVELKKVK